MTSVPFPPVTARALYGAYNGPLYSVKNMVKNASVDICVGSVGGVGAASRAGGALDDKGRQAVHALLSQLDELTALARTQPAEELLRGECPPH